MRKLIIAILFLGFKSEAQIINASSPYRVTGTPYSTTIAYVSSIDGGNNSGVTSSWTYAFTVSSASDRLLVVGISGDVIGGADDITSVTYNGVSMTFSNKTQDNGSGRFQYLYYLLNPATGTNNVVITAATSHYLISGAALYSGVQGVDNAGTNSTSSVGNTLTSSLTTNVNNCWTILFETSYNGNAAPVAGAGLVLRNFDAIFGVWGLFDSNGAITPAQSYNMTTTRTSNANGIAHNMLSIKPY